MCRMLQVARAGFYEWLHKPLREVLTVMGRLALRGSKAVKQRQGMELWYAEGREDPQQNA